MISKYNQTGKHFGQRRGENCECLWNYTCRECCKNAPPYFFSGGAKPGAKPEAKPEAKPKRRYTQKRVNVLCGCGWGLLAVYRREIPSQCPVCGSSIPFES